jgi:hypothetical protein
MDDISPIFFLKLIHDLLQFARLFASCVPQAELPYWGTNPADADSDQPNGLIRLADGFHQFDGCVEYLIFIVCGGG